MSHKNNKTNNISGASKDAPTIVEEGGGHQSFIDGRYDLLFPHATAAMAKVFQRGAEKYGEGNWKLIEPKSHLNHGLMHIMAFLANDTSEENGDVVEHLRHAMWRIAAAVDQYDSGRFTHPYLVKGEE